MLGSGCMSLRMVLVVGLLSLLMAGCFGFDHDHGIIRHEDDAENDSPVVALANRSDAETVKPREVPAETAEQDHMTDIYIYELIDRWNAAAKKVLENPEEHTIGRFEVGRGKSLEINRSWGKEINDQFVGLTGYARPEDGKIDRLFVRGKQTDFDEETLRHLHPFYEILIAFSNPGLSDKERANILKALSLDGDVETLAERSNEDGKNTVSADGIRYDVATIASSEGITFALVVTLKNECKANSILSSCTDIPDASMFRVNVMLPEEIHAGEPAEIQAEIINRSNHLWKGMHGLDLFTFKVKDSEGNDVPVFQGMRIADSIGINFQIKGEGTYRFYQNPRYDSELNQITIQDPGVYLLEATADFLIRHEEEDYPVQIKTEPIEIIVQ